MKVIMSTKMKIINMMMIKMRIMNMIKMIVTTTMCASKRDSVIIS